MSLVYKTKIPIIFSMFLLIFAGPLMAQKSDSVYAAVIKFQSHCCGVPGDTPVRKFISSFRKKYKIKRMAAWHIGPMGREGEYYLAFHLRELNAKQKALFTSKLKIITGKLHDRGSAEFEENMKIEAANVSARTTFEKVIF